MTVDARHIYCIMGGSRFEMVFEADEEPEIPGECESYGPGAPKASIYSANQTTIYNLGIYGTIDRDGSPCGTISGKSQHNTHIWS